MSEPIHAVRVEDVLKKADPITAQRLTVVRCLRSFENEEINWAVDQVVRELKQKISDLEVSDIHLPTFNILTGVSNDPDDKRFNPKDQFQAVLEPIRNATILLFGTCECCGLPHSNTVKLLERLSDYSGTRVTREGEQEIPLFNGIPAMIIATGQDGVYEAAICVAFALNSLGCTLPVQCIATHNTKKGKVFKSQEFAASLSKLAIDTANLIGKE